MIGEAANLCCHLSSKAGIKLPIDFGRRETAAGGVAFVTRAGNESAAVGPKSAVGHFPELQAGDSTAEASPSIRRQDSIGEAKFSITPARTGGRVLSTHRGPHMRIYHRGLLPLSRPFHGPLDRPPTLRFAKTVHLLRAPCR